MNQEKNLKKVTIHESDLLKILDVLEKNEDFHVARDEMNSYLHMSEVRYSPLTSATISAVERLENLIPSVKTIKQAVKENHAERD